MEIHSEPWVEFEFQPSEYSIEVGSYCQILAKSVRYLDRWDLRHLETLEPLVTSLRSVTTAQGLRVFKCRRSLSLGINYL